MSESRKHHYIPACYLRGFAREKRKTQEVIAFDLVRNKKFPVSVQNIAAQRDFNRYETTEHDPNKLEHEYAKFEDLVAPVLRKYDSMTAPATGEEFNILMNFMALLAARNPNNRTWLADEKIKIAKRQLNNLVLNENRFRSSVEHAKVNGFISSKVRDIDFSEASAFIQNEEYFVEIAQETIIRQELKLIDPILETLGRRSWTYYRASPESGAFVTSDHPVVLEHNDFNSQRPFGFGSRNTTLAFAISKNLAAIGTFEGKTSLVSATIEQTAAINTLIIKSSAEQIYSYDGNFSYLGENGILPGHKLLSDKDFLLNK